MGDKWVPNGVEIRRFRERREWSQCVMAKKVGLQLRHYQNAEYGKHCVGERTLRRIAAVHGCGLGDVAILVAPAEIPAGDPLDAWLVGTEPIDVPVVLHPDDASLLGPPRREKRRVMGVACAIAAIALA